MKSLVELGMEVTQRQLAAILNLTTQQIRNLEDKGLPFRVDGRFKFYDLSVAIPWYVEFKCAEAIARRGGGDERFEDARIRREQARARIAEMDVALREERTYPRAVVDDVYGKKLLDVLRAGIMNMPGRWASQVLGLKKPREAEAALKRVAVELLEEFSGPIADRLEAGGDTLPESCPGRELLVAAGVDSMSALLELEDLSVVRGIGPATQRRLRAWLAGVTRAA